MAERYTVVFFGETLKGFDAAVVQAAMGEQFRLPPAQLAQLFSGRAVPLKKYLDADAAQRFVDAMSTLGAKVELQSALDGTCAAADGAGGMLLRRLRHQQRRPYPKPPNQTPNSPKRRQIPIALRRRP